MSSISQQRGKTYLAAVLLGTVTETDDLDGWTIAEREASAISREMIDAELPQFIGAITQIPPAYSAVHVDGQRAYALARAGRTVDMPARTVTVHRLTIVAWKPPVAWLVVDCGAGTYVRALARDLGDALGCGATLARLVRLRSGPFPLCAAWSLDELEAVPDLAAAWQWIAVHPDAALMDWPALLLNDAAARQWANGQTLSGGHDTPDGTLARAYDAQGNWRGVALRDGDLWRPHKGVRTEG